MTIMPLNKALKHAIIDSDRTQTQVAKRARISVVRLSLIVRGHLDPTAGEKRRLARVLQQPVADLFPVAISPLLHRRSA